MGRIKRGNVYRFAFWILIRKLSLDEFKDAMDILKIACSVENLTDEETGFILNESVDSYLTRDCLFNNKN